MDNVEEKRPPSFREIQMLCLYQMAQGSETLQAWLRAAEEAAKKTVADSERMKLEEEMAALKLELAQAKGPKVVEDATDSAASV